eukprot:15313235-Ditylum_brightwellii.AAC.1
MGIFLDSPDIPVQALEPLNVTWYVEEATTLAEITRSDRKRIHPESFHPEQIIDKEKLCHRHDPTTWQWHGNIDKATQRVWQDSLRAMVCNHEGVLHRQLGKWLVKTSDGNIGALGNSYISNMTTDGESRRF